MKSIGIDIGANAIDICIANEETEPKNWKTIHIELAGKWKTRLKEILDDTLTLAALEPTGAYARPIVQVLEQAGARIIFVKNQATRHIRIDQVATQKTDANDARALAIKANEYRNNGGSTRGAREYNPAREATTLTLKLLINARNRSIKAKRSELNRIRVFAHSIEPALAKHLQTYIKCVRASSVGPDEIKRLAEDNAITIFHHVTRKAIKRLANEIEEPLPAPPTIIEEIKSAVDRLDAAEAEAKRIERQITEIIESPELSNLTNLWRSIPVASDMTIASVHAATACNAANLTEDEFKAVTGCHPCRNESGAKRKAREAHAGKIVKAGLHMWTLLLLHPKTPDNPVRDHFTRLKQRGHRYSLAASRAKLVKILSAIARHGKPYRYIGTGTRTNVLSSTEPDGCRQIHPEGPRGPGTQRLEQMF